MEGLWKDTPTGVLSLLLSLKSRAAAAMLTTMKTTETALTAMMLTLAAQGKSAEMKAQITRAAVLMLIIELWVD